MCTPQIFFCCALQPGNVPSVKMKSDFFLVHVQKGKYWCQEGFSLKENRERVLAADKGFFYKNLVPKAAKILLKYSRR